MKKKPCRKNPFQNQHDMSQIGLLFLHRGKCKAEQTSNEGVVSKETVVLRRWGSSIQKFGFINGVDNVNWPPYRDSKS